MNLPDIVKWMLENNYMVCVKGKYRVTAKFNKEVIGEYVGVTVTPQGPVVIEQSLTIQNSGPIDWTEFYLKFIREAEVPSKGYDRMQRPYDLNKYSEPAAKAFRHMIEKEGVIYAVVVKSTMLYYKTTKAFPMTVGRYISEGQWRSDYTALMVSVKDGNLETHIQKQIDEGSEFNPVRRG